MLMDFSCSVQVDKADFRKIQQEKERLERIQREGEYCISYILENKKLI